MIEVDFLKYVDSFGQKYTYLVSETVYQGEL